MEFPDWVPRRLGRERPAQRDFAYIGYPADRKLEIFCQTPGKLLWT